MHTTDSDRSSPAVARASRRLARLAFAVAAVAGAACTESIPPTPIASLRITPGADSFFVGRTTASAPFAVTMLDANNTEIRDGRAITYTSSAPDVFTVDSKTGVLTAKAAGSGLYRATADGRFIEATVKVIHPVDKVVLNTGDFSLTVGTTRQLVPTVLAPDGSAISGRVLNFSSSQPSVASVSTGGLVTAIAEGTTTIYVGVEGKLASAVVTVTREAVASIQLNPPVAQLLRIGGQLQITASPRNAANLPLAGRTVTWFTNNPTVATVTQQGLVSAVGVGNATITAECEGRTATLQVTVTLIPVGSVTFTQVADTLIPNDQKQFNPVVRDTAGNVIPSLLGRTVAYTASNNLVLSTAAASAGVIVTAQNTVGSATITATIDNVSTTVPLTITVPQVDQVSISPSQATVQVGSTVQLTVTIRDANGNSLVVNRPIIGFASNATAVATVPPTGGQVVTVTARAAGTAIITASVNGFPASATITVP
jgi:uncharacterized protein YjdB